ncbi:transposase [Shewanella sp. VB17]|nr:transposase [Shewanella sp. VB17]
MKENGSYIGEVIYILFTLNMQGKVLGLRLSENKEGNCWLSLLFATRHQGLKDIFFACIDRLTPFPKAIAIIFPATVTQLYAYLSFILASITRLIFRVLDSYTRAA